MAATYQVNLSESMKVLWLCSNSDPSKVESKQFMKQWVILSSNLPGEGSLHFYSSKAAVLHNPAVSVEALSEMINVCHLGYSKKQLILQLTYSDHSILLLFSSVATMKLWQEKLKAFLYCYPLCLLKCSYKPYETGNYIVSYADNSLSVFSARSNDLMWRWSIGHLRRYSYEPKVPFIEIEAGRSSETGEGKFFFTGKRSRHLYNLLESLSFNARSPNRYISSSSTSASMLVVGGLIRSKSNSIDISKSADEVISRSVDISRTDDAPRCDSAGYLTILGPSSASPMASRKFFIQKNMSAPSRTDARLNGEAGSTTTAGNHYGSHRSKHLFTTQTDSLDEQFFNDENEVVFSEPRSHSVPDIKETFHNGGVLQDHNPSKNNKVPFVNVVPVDCSTHEDDNDEDNYVNFDDMKVILSLK